MVKKELCKDMDWEVCVDVARGVTGVCVYGNSILLCGFDDAACAVVV